MFRRPVKEINAEFPAEEKHLDGIQRVVREACASAGMTRKDTSAVLLAIEEAATNVIRHAYLYEEGTLRLRITLYGKFISFSLIDFGRSFRPGGSGKLDLRRLVESGRRGGLGFYMIQKIMDTVEYVSWSGQNELRMTKRLGTAGERAAPPLLRRMFTLRVKFSLWTFLIVSIIIAAAFYAVNHRTTSEIYGHLDGTVNALGQTIAEQSALYIINRRSDVEFDELVVSYQRSNDMLRRIVLTDTGGLILAHSDDIRNIRRPYQPPAFVDTSVSGSPQRTTVEGRELNYLILPISTGERRLGTVHLTYSSERIQERLAEARRSTLQLTGVLLLMGIAGIYLLSNYFVKPIANITRGVRRFSRGDLETELPLEGADEFFEISNALNEMMNRMRRDRETAVEREKLAKELEVASQIQKTLLPRALPALSGLEVEAFYRAASMIGGDLYDIFELDNHRCCLVVADVAGKGVPASLVMSMLRTVIRIYARQTASARDTLVQANDYLTGNIPRGMFITVLMVVFDSTNRRLNLVSAGHNPLLLYRAGSQQVVRLNPSGMPLGVPSTEQTDFRSAVEEVELKLDEGDTFMLYTDGVTEAVNREGEQYGLERLRQFFQSRWDEHPPDELKAVATAIVEEIDAFAGFASQRDDITFVLGRAAAVDQPKSHDAPRVESRSLREGDAAGHDA